MPYLKRTIDAVLLEWKLQKQRMPLLLRGARQVGKTEAVREFGKGFENFLEFNFERQTDLQKLFEKDLSAPRILRELELQARQKISPGRTLVFFDEIQDCPRALTSLRYFYEEIEDLHIIAAGSLLEFALEKVSFPVGRVTSEYMYPLSFSEFLEAMEESALIDHIPRLDTLEATKKSEVASSRLRQWVQSYFIVGGMPKAVVEFKQTRSFVQVAKIQADLVQDFQDDMRKYVRGDKQLLSCGSLFSRLFKFIGKQITYTEIGGGDDIKRTRHSFELLEQAMVIHLVRSVKPAGLPLGAEASDKHFKCIFLDIGLGQNLAGFDASQVARVENLLDLYEGRLAEQFVGQQLLVESKGCESRKLYCWIRPERGSSAEVDFILSRSGNAVPVEVKSGKSGRLRSLHLFLEKYGGQGICLQDISSPIQQDRLTFLPLHSII